MEDAGLSCSSGAQYSEIIIGNPATLGQKMGVIRSGDGLAIPE